MKKSKCATSIVFAAAGIFVGAANAHAAKVQLYGVIDAGITHFTGLAPVGGGAGETVSSTGLSGGVLTPDRFGIRGAEDLGGGLSTTFEVETGFCGVGTNQGASASQVGPLQTYCTGGGFMQSQTWLALNGKFGQVKAGRMYSMAFINEAVEDPFGWGLTGSIGTLGLTGEGGDFFTLHTNQTIQYTTPTINGLTGSAAYSFAPVDGGTVPTASGIGSEVPRMLSVQAKYGKGAASIGATYERMRNDPYGLSAAGVNDGDINLWQIYGGYDFGLAKLTGLYERASGNYAYGTSTGAAAGGDKFWMIGAHVPIASGALLLSYSELNVSDASVLLPSSVHGTAKFVAVGYRWQVSKETNLYASYGLVKNDQATAFSASTASEAFAGVAGRDSSGMAIGMRRSF